VQTPCPANSNGLRGLKLAGLVYASSWHYVKSVDLAQKLVRLNVKGYKKDPTLIFGQSGVKFGLYFPYFRNKIRLCG